jgi:uncharacterized damage-inducible protein DinB
MAMNPAPAAPPASAPPTSNGAPAWRDHFIVLARYGAWATSRLYEHVDRLTDDEYRRDAGLFFGSVHRTLNHLLVAEHLWYPRFAEGISNRLALDTELEADRAALKRRLVEGGARWGPLVATWPEARYAGTLDYTTTKGAPASFPFAVTLAHVFNHGTHHRGQASAALTAMGYEAPVMDLVAMLQMEQALAAADVSPASASARTASAAGVPTSPSTRR